MRRSLALALGLVAACALPAPAFAGVTMTGFSVVPSSTQGGGHPNVTITQTFSYTNTTDSVKDAFVRLQPGLLGNPQSATFCTQAQFAADSCPASSVVGSVVVVARVHVLLAPTDLTNQGTVYNLRPTGDEPARVGVVVRPSVGGVVPLSKIFLQSAVYVRPGSDGYGLESTFADQPNSSNDIPLQIVSVKLTFNGKASGGTFMRMPSSCATGRSLSRANSWEAPSTFSERDFQMTPSNCDALGFAPRAEGSMGAPGITKAGQFPPFSTTLRFDPEEAALQRAEVILPQSVGGNFGGLQRACPRELSDAGNCPASSRVGTAIIDAPLQPQPVRGPVYLAFNSDALFPGLLVLLPPPVNVRLDGIIEALPVLGTRNTFPSNPDLPVRSFTLEFDGGRPDSALTIAQDLCSSRADLSMNVRLVAHNGKVSQFDQVLATPGCDPVAKLGLRRGAKKRREVRLIAKMTAPRDGQGITKVDLRLPKTLRRGKARPYLVSGGRRVRVRPNVRARRVTMTLPREYRRARLVWKGLRASPGLRRTAVIRLNMTDGRDKVTPVKRRVDVEGKLPRPRGG